MINAEMTVIPRFGYALITVDETTTYLCSHDVTSEYFNFSVIGRFNTYQEALACAQILGEENGVLDVISA